MRWMYVIPRLIIVLMLWAFLTWGLDPLIRYSAVQSLQSITGAKADISELQSTLYPPGLHIRGMALASASRPGTNLLEFDELRFDLVGDPLLRRQFVVEEGRLTGVRFNTLRKDDGQLEAVPESEEDQEPSWLTEQIMSLGDEWLTKLTEDIRQQLDPNTLETYRTGSEIRLKWEDRLNDLADRGRLLKPRLEQLKSQFENARRSDPVRQIELYLQLAQEAQRLTAEAEQLKAELSGIVPEVRTDFARLDNARQNDVQMIRHQLDLLKPDGRRISESLLGEPMYRQLQQLLSWVELAKHYQQDLKEQTTPERGRGTDFRFPILNPAPDFLLRRLLVSGELRMDRSPVPFEAVLTDVTSDAPLLGRPCVMRLKAAGESSLLMQVTFDATGPKTITHLAAAWKNPQGSVLRAGKDQQATLSARLADIDWNLNLSLEEDQLNGRVRLNSQLTDQTFTASTAIRPEFAQAAQDVLNSIRDVEALLDISGTVRRPKMRLESSLGQQIGEGMQTAVRAQLENAQQRLAMEVNEFANEQVAQLKTRFGSRYEELMQENAKLIAQVQEVQTVVAALRSGKIDPDMVFRQVSDSKLIPEEQKQAVKRAAEDIDKALDKAGLPDGLRGLTQPSGTGITVPGINPGGTAPRLPGFVPGTLPGSLPIRVPGFGAPPRGAGSAPHPQPPK